MWFLNLYLMNFNLISAMFREELQTSLSCHLHIWPRHGDEDHTSIERWDKILVLLSQEHLHQGSKWWDLQWAPWPRDQDSRPRTGFFSSHQPLLQHESKPGEAHRVSFCKQKLQQLKDEFYTFAKSSEVAKELQVPEELGWFLYQY